MRIQSIRSFLSLGLQNKYILQGLVLALLPIVFLSSAWGQEKPGKSKRCPGSVGEVAGGPVVSSTGTLSTSSDSADLVEVNLTGAPSIRLAALPKRLPTTVHRVVGILGTTVEVWKEGKGPYQTILKALEGALSLNVVDLTLGVTSFGPFVSGRGGVAEVVSIDLDNLRRRYPADKDAGVVVLQTLQQLLRDNVYISSHAWTTTMVADWPLGGLRLTPRVGAIVDGEPFDFNTATYDKQFEAQVSTIENLTFPARRLLVAKMRNLGILQTQTGRDRWHLRVTGTRAALEAATQLVVGDEKSVVTEIKILGLSRSR